MAFIPNQSTVRIGDRVRLTEPLEFSFGTFTVGHEFTIKDYSPRGWDLIDSETYRVCEVSSSKFMKIADAESKIDDRTYCIVEQEQHTGRAIGTIFGPFNYAESEAMLQTFRDDGDPLYDYIRYILEK